MLYVMTSPRRPPSIRANNHKLAVLHRAAQPHPTLLDIGSHKLSMDKAKSTIKKGLEKVTKLDEERTLFFSLLPSLQSSLSVPSPAGRPEGSF